MSHPGAWRVVGDAFLDLLGQTTGVTGVDALAGTATSGIPHASVLANRLRRPLVYVTFEDAKEGRVEGIVETEDRVVMIEDHISTGSSVLASAAVLRSRGARVDWCLAIFTYGYPVARANFDKRRMTFETLCDLETLLAVATERGDIDEEQKQAVLEWRSDPQGWTAQEEARMQDRSNADGV
jgi:orotate phosphoribosyltransferase